MTQSGHPRSANPAGLADQVRHLTAQCPISVQDHLDGALNEALAWAAPDDLICITGSIFVVAQARRAWAKRHPEAFAPDDWVFQDETAGETAPDEIRKWNENGRPFEPLSRSVTLPGAEPGICVAQSTGAGPAHPPRRREPRRPRGRDLESLEGNDYPVLPVPDTVVFPNMISPIFIGRDLSFRAVEAAEAAEVPLLVVAQRDPEVQDPDLPDLYSIGTAVEVGRILRMPDGNTTVLVQGIERVRIVDLVETEPYLRVRGVPLYEDERHDMASEALMRAVLALFEKVVELNVNIPEDAYVAAMNEKEPGSLADLLSHVLDLELPKRQELLETLDANVRLQRLSIILGQELDVLELENRIHTKVQEEVDKTQREYYLREQMRAIQTELGEGDETKQTVDELRGRLEAAGLPAEVKSKAEKELARLAIMHPMSPDASIIHTYLDLLLRIAVASGHRRSPGYRPRRRDPGS